MGTTLLLPNPVNSFKDVDWQRPHQNLPLYADLAEAQALIWAGCEDMAFLSIFSRWRSRTIAADCSRSFVQSHNNTTLRRVHLVHKASVNVLDGLQVQADYCPSYPTQERERLQCFSQPTSLITYRRRQMSNLEEIETTQNKLENPHVILLRKKGPHSVSVRGK